MEPVIVAYFSQSCFCRYASISSYLSECSQKYNYNDIELVCDEKSYNRLKEKGINEEMAKHISHLFIR